MYVNLITYKTENKNAKGCFPFSADLAAPVAFQHGLVICGTSCSVTFPVPSG